MKSSCNLKGDYFLGEACSSEMVVIFAATALDCKT